jgi:hypothetical protein
MPDPEFSAIQILAWLDLPALKEGSTLGELFLPSGMPSHVGQQSEYEGE